MKAQQHWRLSSQDAQQHTIKTVTRKQWKYHEINLKKRISLTTSNYEFVQLGSRSSLTLFAWQSYTIHNKIAIIHQTMYQLLYASSSVYHKSTVLIKLNILYEDYFEEHLRQNIFTNRPWKVLDDFAFMRLGWRANVITYYCMLTQQISNQLLIPQHLYQTCQSLLNVDGRLIEMDSVGPINVILQLFYWYWSIFEISCFMAEHNTNTVYLTYCFITYLEFNSPS